MAQGAAHEVDAQPRLWAIFFREDQPSAATIGYLCEVEGVYQCSQRRYSYRQDQWLYRVLVCATGKHQDVRGEQLLFTKHACVPEVILDAPHERLEYRIYAPLGCDHDELHGAYRSPLSDWEPLIFRKTDGETLGFQWRFKVRGTELRERRLVVSVPRSACLDGQYVLSVMSQLGNERLLPPG